MRETLNLIHVKKDFAIAWLLTSVGAKAALTTGQQLDRCSMTRSVTAVLRDQRRCALAGKAAQNGRSEKTVAGQVTSRCAA